MKKGNFVTAACFAAFAVYIIWECASFPASKGNVPGPGFYPTAVATLMLMAAISLCISTVRMTPEEDRTLGLLDPDRVRVYICMFVLVVYTVLVPIVGFCVMSALLLFGLILWFGRYDVHVCMFFSIAVTGVIYGVFNYVLHVPFRFGFLM